MIAMKPLLTPACRHRIKKIIKISSGIIILAIVIYIVFPYKKGYLASSNKVPVVIYDRNGTVLMEVAKGKSGLCQAISIQQLPEDFISLLLFSEDRSFYHHWGISLKSIARALYQNCKAMRIVSGGSTITQQVVKSKKEILRNTVFTKMLELIEAVRIELHFSKEEILQGYINEVYLGNNIYGFEKAAQIYFGKHIKECNLLEVGFLIAIVKAPERYNPYQNPEKVVQSAKKLLRNACQLGYIKISPFELEVYTNSRIALQYNEKKVIAPLFCLYALSQARSLFPNKDITHIYTTLDSSIYSNVLTVMQNSMTMLKDKNALHAALVMIDNTTMEIVAMIGSVDFFDYNKGQVDATLIKRQAASTMKPFAYALALETGIFHTSSIVPDVYTQFPSKVGNYIPKNFSDSYHGPVRFAKALGCSYNIPAVYVVSKVGLVSYYNLLKKIGFDSVTRSPSYYGLGLVLGNADVSLLELANAYTVFPRQGLFSKTIAIKKIRDAHGKGYTVQPAGSARVLKQQTCYLMSHILSEYKYKVDAFGLCSSINFPFPFAVKTGTSKDFKDNFIAGYNTQYTFAVWVGNLYNESLCDLPAVSGAGIVLKDVLLYLWNAGYPFARFTMPKNIKKVKICTLSGMIADTYCPDSDYELYSGNNQPCSKCTWHQKKSTIVPSQFKEWAKNKNYNVAHDAFLHIIFPGDGVVFKIEKTVRKNLQAIPLKATANSNNIKWYVDNLYIGEGSERVWQLTAGHHVISAQAGNQKDVVKITVLE